MASIEPGFREIKRSGVGLTVEGLPTWWARLSLVGFGAFCVWNASSLLTRAEKSLGSTTAGLWSAGASQDLIHYISLDVLLPSPVCARAFIQQKSQRLLCKLQHWSSLWPGCSWLAEPHRWLHIRTFIPASSHCISFKKEFPINHRFFWTVSRFLQFLAKPFEKYLSFLTDFWCF